MVKLLVIIAVCALWLWFVGARRNRRIRNWRHYWN